MSAINALLSGTLFAVGLVVSGMTLPAKVVGFLDVTGRWDPSLAMVMVGAIGVYALAYRLALRRSTPLAEPMFHLPSRTEIDRRVLAGAALFGFGWGLGGFCPGPAIVSLGAGSQEAMVFIAGMLGGVILYRVTERWLPADAAETQPECG